MNSYEITYDRILDLQRELISTLETQSGETEIYLIHALSATYLLQDYLAQRIAEVGPSPEGEDWELL
ncbi:MAG TPA: hypothetical protein DCO69_02925 [Clostridiales bacterium]|nr:hypothetical protein [Clostridiales bacterium]